MFDEKQSVAHVLAAARIRHALHQAQCMAIRDSPHADQMNGLTDGHARS
jgi:hypothetical protein